MTRQSKKDLLQVVAILICLAIGMGLVTGPDDFEEALNQERIICENHKPAPEFCHVSR